MSENLYLAHALEVSVHTLNLSQVLSARSEAHAVIQNLVDTVVDSQNLGACVNLGRQYAALDINLSTAASEGSKRDTSIEMRLARLENALERVVADWGATVQVASEALRPSSHAHSCRIQKLPAHRHLRAVFPGVAS